MELTPLLRRPCQDHGVHRPAALDRAQSEQPFDLVIIGGGATGLGIAVDAAARGHRVALFERSDFGKGTSSRSTKLVHGGVRYLRQGNISLVLDALRERGRLARNAPHLVHPQQFLIPNYSWWEGPFYGIGMKVYDQLAGSLGLAPSRWLSREETLAAVPNLERENLLGGVVYHDGQFDDARLAISLARTATGLGAAVINYCECIGLLKSARGQLEGVIVRDRETGTEFSVRSRAVVNATGVFVDAVRRLDSPDSCGLVAASQGIHLVLPSSFLGDTAILVPKTQDGRVLFAVPWHGRVVVGTTDTPVTALSEEPRAREEECAFVLDHARRYLARDPSENDVLSVFAGLRPLVRSGDTARTAALSRDHTIVVAESGLVTITGGKWTTYRKMAEDAVDQAEMVAGLPNRRCSTETLPIHGSPKAIDNAVDTLSAYGSDAGDIRSLARSEPSLENALVPGLPYLCAEVVWHVRYEMARTVEDILARRTRALFLEAKASLAAAPAVARLLARELGRDGAWEHQQVADFSALARRYIFQDPSSREPSTS